MATTSNPGSGQKQPTSSSSRFASLKVFKFAAGSSKHSPPVPPPKDNVPTSGSCVSLVSHLSTPMTPASPDYTRSQSTPPFPAVHSPAFSSQDPASASSSATSFGKGLIKFAKRSLTPKSTTRQLSESSAESQISMPWNFQVCFSSLIDLSWFCGSIYAGSSPFISPLSPPIQSPVIRILVADVLFALSFAPPLRVRCIL